MQLLVTGTRNGRPDVELWLSRWQRKYGAPELLIVGGAKGVDTQAEIFGLRASWKVRVVPVTREQWRLLGGRAGHERNQQMVDLCAQGDHCLAFPSPVRRSAGTWDCVTRARAAQLAVWVLPLKAAA